MLCLRVFDLILFIPIMQMVMSILYRGILYNSCLLCALSWDLSLCASL